MFLTEIHFYYHKENGKVCVQNRIGGMCGQYHEHTSKEFEEWREVEEREFGKEYLHEVK